MKRGHGINERYAEDPINSHEPRGKSSERRKHRLDGSTLTPTEQHIKNGLMRQFMRNPEGSAHRDERAYKESPVWCPNCDGRRMRAAGLRCCEACHNARSAVAWEFKDPDHGF